MSDRTWPTTAKQRSYGTTLEDQLDLPLSPWHSMTVDEARDRISILVDLRKTMRDPSSLEFLLFAVGRE